MDLALTEEQQLIVTMVRQFVREEIVPLEEHLDPDADELPPDDYHRLVEKTQAMGLYGLDTPPEYGGPDIDLITRCLIAIECSQHRAGLYAPCYNVFGGARQAQLFEATVVPRDFDLVAIPFPERGGPELVRSGARTAQPERTNSILVEPTRPSVSSS